MLQVLPDILAMVEAAMTITGIVDGRLGYQIQRKTVLVCRFTHLTRVMPEEALTTLAANTDAR